MNYLIIGAGGTGAAIASRMAKAGKDVTMIARGAHLEAIKANGLKVTWAPPGKDPVYETVPVKAMSFDEYAASGEVPDAAIMCTKSYSVPDAAPDIDRVIGDRTIVIPIMNGLMMGDYIKRYVKGGRPLDGCMFIMAKRDAPGELMISSPTIRVVFGPDEGFCDECPVTRAEADAIAADLNESGIICAVSDNILSDTVRKFAFVSPAGAAGLCYGGDNTVMRAEGEPRELYKSLIREVQTLGEAMGAVFDGDLVEQALAVSDRSSGKQTTSLQRDVLSGHQSEFESQVVEPVRIGAKYGLEMPTYRKVAETIIERYGLDVTI